MIKKLSEKNVEVKLDDFQTVPFDFEHLNKRQQRSKTCAFENKFSELEE